MTAPVRSGFHRAADGGMACRKLLGTGDQVRRRSWYANERRSWILARGGVALAAT